MGEYQGLNHLMRLLIFGEREAYRNLPLAHVLPLLLGHVSFLINLMCCVANHMLGVINIVVKLEAWIALGTRLTSFMSPRARSGGNVVCLSKTYCWFFSDRIFLFSSPWSMVNIPLSFLLKIYTVLGTVDNFELFSTSASSSTFPKFMNLLR